MLPPSLLCGCSCCRRGWGSSLCSYWEDSCGSRWPCCCCSCCVCLSHTPTRTSLAVTAGCYCYFRRGCPCRLLAACRLSMAGHARCLILLECTCPLAFGGLGSALRYPSLFPFLAWTSPLFARYSPVPILRTSPCCLAFLAWCSSHSCSGTRARLRCRSSSTGGTFGGWKGSCTRAGCLAATGSARLSGCSSRRILQARSKRTCTNAHRMHALAHDYPRVFRVAGTAGTSCSTAKKGMQDGMCPSHSILGLDYSNDTVANQLACLQ